MGMFIRQDENRSELQQKIASELQEKAKQRTLDADRPDGIDDSSYVENMKSTTSLAWVWVLIGIAAIAVIVWLVIESTRLLQ